MARRTETLTVGQGFGSVGVVAGYMLKVIRRSASLTQEQLAGSLSVDVSTVQGWESGRRPLSAVNVGDLIRLGHHLARRASSASVLAHLYEAIGADSILSAGISWDVREGTLEQHPLSAGVLRRSTMNLITWPVTRIFPPHLGHLTVEPPGRGPVSRYPILDTETRLRFFDHLLAVAERATASEESLLLRQAVYLLGFDNRNSTAQWLHNFHSSVTRRPCNVHEHLIFRSAALALGSTGDLDRVHELTEMANNSDAEMLNLNYWAHWVGETFAEQIDDEFLMRASDNHWNGGRLLSDLANRLDVGSVHRPLILKSLHSLPHYRPQLFASTPPGLRDSLNARLEIFETSPQVARSERDQAIGLMYALRTARR